MFRKHILYLSACIVMLMMGATSCDKEEDPVPGKPTAENGFDGGYGYVGGFISENQNFETDWASMKTIDLITEHYYENDREVTRRITVPLPWAWDKGPQQWLPNYTARNMAEIDADDWEMAFNLTGIKEKPGEHYFGLYNRYTGILRVFYYLTEDRVPSHDGNDHMWNMGLTKDLIEHVTFQFAIPYGEEATDSYKAALGGNDAVFSTTAITSACTNEGKVTPAQGWWAYDIDMSAMRKHDFFESDRSIMRPGMQVFNQDNVVLNSIMHGTLDGSFGGNMNLNSLKGAGTTNGGIVSGLVGNFMGGFLTNLKLLDYAFYNGPADQAPSIGPVVFSIIGIAFGTAGKGLESNLKAAREDPDKLGDFNGKINLTLDATIETVGSIGGERTTLVPSPELNVSAFFNRVDGFGEGVWNIEHHPDIYVVTDAFWGDKAKFSSVEKVTSEGRTAYQLTNNPDDVGLRLISFMDPTSIGGVRFNPDALPDGIDGNISVTTSYAVLKNSAPGYTRGFRKAIGLDYEEPELTSKDTFQSDDPDVGFKIIKKAHADGIFTSEIPEDIEDVIGYRMTQQMTGQNIHRRLFGPAAFYSNPNASPNEVDDVAMVSNPQVFLPVNSASRLLFNMEIPDFVVTAVMSLNAADDVAMFHSLRFIPRIKFVKLKDLPDIYAEIVKRSKSLPASGVDYPNLDQDLADIKDIVDNAK